MGFVHACVSIDPDCGMSAWICLAHGTGCYAMHAVYLMIYTSTVIKPKQLQLFRWLTLVQYILYFLHTHIYKRASV